MKVVGVRFDPWGGPSRRGAPFGLRRNGAQTPAAFGRILLDWLGRRRARARARARGRRAGWRKGVLQDSSEIRSDWTESGHGGGQFCGNLASSNLMDNYVPSLGMALFGLGSVMLLVGALIPTFRKRRWSDWAMVGGMTKDRPRGDPRKTAGEGSRHPGGPAGGVESMYSVGWTSLPDGDEGPASFAYK
jgi:hypothetical protein